MKVDRVIVDFRNGAVPTIYDYLKEEESDDEARKRAVQANVDNMITYAKNHLKYPTIMEDGSEYWQNRYNEAKSAVFQIMDLGDFFKIEREFLLKGEPEEITSERFHEMLNVLPLFLWCTHNNVEMFCMSEFWRGSYTNQYAHDLKTDKYYTKMVDAADRRTWICEYLKKTA